MNTTPEQRQPAIRLQTHGFDLVEQADGPPVRVERRAYSKHYYHTSTMRQAFEDIQADTVNLAGRTGKIIVRALRGFAGQRRMAGWWIYRVRKTS